MEEKTENRVQSHSEEDFRRDNEHRDRIFGYCVVAFVGLGLFCYAIFGGWRYILAGAGLGLTLGSLMYIVKARGRNRVR